MPSSVRKPLAAVVAIGRNGAIGRGNALPWTMPSDLARFKALTLGKPMIMGRRTFDSIDSALPGRESIVVTRRAMSSRLDGVHLVATPQDALDLAGARALAMTAPEIVLIGGAALFAALMAEVDAIHMTIIDLRPAADTFFPALDPYVWREMARHRPPRAPNDEADCVFVDYERA